jgi:hypothetical protein
VIVHTYPVNDLIEHATDGSDCPCGPTTEAVFRDDGSNGWQVIHQSLDGREQSENAPRAECCGDGPAGHTQQEHHDASPCYSATCPLDHPRGGPFPTSEYAEDHAPSPHANGALRSVVVTPRCSCGKPFSEDGGAEGVCECCTGCVTDPESTRDRCACGEVSALTRTGFGLVGDDFVHNWTACVIYRDRRADVRDDIEELLQEAGRLSATDGESS